MSKDIYALKRGDEVVYQQTLKGKFVRYLYRQGITKPVEAIVEFGSGTSSKVVPLESIALPYEEVEPL